MELEPFSQADADDLIAFLGQVDLTTSGLDAPSVRLWLVRDADGTIVGSTGYETGRDGCHALIRSVAVSATHRSHGRGSALAMFALERAAAGGAETAWLFSRRSGPFWQSLGFAPADRDELAEALADTQQVRLFRRTGQLGREVAWSRPLAAVVADHGVIAVDWRGTDLGAPRVCGGSVPRGCAKGRRRAGA